VIVEAFLRWAEKAKTADRARAAAALGRAFLMARITPRERAAAAMAMTYLLDDPSPRVRLALAEVLADTPKAPRAVVMSLAEDQPDIASTIILRSPALTDADLVDLVGRGSTMTRALVASRISLSRAVSAAIAEVGEWAEVLTLLENSGAEISRATLKRLAERHGADGDIRSLLLQRDELPADARHLLMLRVSEALAGFDLVRVAVGNERARRITAEARDAGTVSLAGSTAVAELPALVEHLRIDGRLTPAFLMHALCSGKVDFIAAALVNLSGLDDRRVRSILSTGRMHALRALYEATGLPRDVSAVFVEATLLWRRAATLPIGTLLQSVSTQLLDRFRSERLDATAEGELLDMVEKLNIAEQRQMARDCATLAA